MWVCRCVHTKRVDSAGGSVKPQSGQGAESDRIAIDLIPTRGLCCVGGSGCEAGADRVEARETPTAGSLSQDVWIADGDA
jgi:hypothetical protein